MNIIKGQVVSNADTTEEGKFLAIFPKVGPDAFTVTYTSPFFKVNAGGFLGIPDKGDQILAVHNEFPEDDEEEFYYHSTIVARKDINADEEDDKFNVFPQNDLPTYSAKGKPTTQHFTNGAGAGMYIQREKTPDKITNNVVLKSEDGHEVCLSPLGVQIKNSDGDSIVLNGAEPNDAYGSRSLFIETQGSQEYKCLAGDMNLRVTGGGDVNIENNSFGVYAIPPWFGNVRIKSRFRDVTLAALGPTSKIHIVTNTGKITIDTLTGEIKMFTPTNISLESLGTINLNAGVAINLNSAALNLNSQALTTLNSTGGTFINSQGTVGINSNGATTVAAGAVLSLGSNGAVKYDGASHIINNIPLATMNPTGGDISVVIPVGAPAPVSPATSNPTPPLMVPPLPNDYADGFTGPGAT